MIAAISTAEALGLGFFCLQSAPRGTPSRVHRLRLVNALRPPRTRAFVSDLSPPSASPSAGHTTSPPSSSASVAGRHPARRDGLDDDEWELLRHITAQRPVSRPGPTQVVQCPIQPTDTCHLAADRADVSAAAAAKALVSSARHDLLRNLRSVQAALAYLRPFDLRGHDEHAIAQRRELRFALADIPPNTFSELLQTLDPLTAVVQVLDWAPDVHIGPGIAQYTRLGRYVDKHGVRRLYVQLLKMLLAVTKMRQEAGHNLGVSDYRVLLRCAGAASDPLMARLVWRIMDEKAQWSLRDGDLSNEFIKARFLTESLYSQHNSALFRVSPVNLYKQKLDLPWRTIHKLRRLRYKQHCLQASLFGYNRHVRKAEHLTRILRKTKPIRNVFFECMQSGVDMDEKLLCSAMIAFARAGSLAFVQDTILLRYWGIRVRRDPATGQAKIFQARNPLNSQRDSPLSPTALLLDAVVEAFCCNSELVTAWKLLDFISKQYDIPIPDKVWFKLLEWAYVLASRPVAQEWKVLAASDSRFKYKIVRSDAVQIIFKAMVSEPYKVRPGFDQKIILIKSLISSRRHREAIRQLLELHSAYVSALGQLENAFYDHGHTMQLGIDTTQSAIRWRRAESRKLSMWYAIEVCLWQLMKNVRSSRSDDIVTVRLIPQLLNAFRIFVARPPTYRIATGHVQIHMPGFARRLRQIRSELELPPVITRDMVRLRSHRSNTKDGDDASRDQWIPYSARRDERYSMLRRRVKLRIFTPVSSSAAWGQKSWRARMRTQMLLDFT